MKSLQTRAGWTDRHPQATGILLCLVILFLILLLFRSASAQSGNAPTLGAPAHLLAVTQGAPALDVLAVPPTQSSDGKGWSARDFRETFGISPYFAGALLAFILRMLIRRGRR
jgi:hypothetical protein